MKFTFEATGIGSLPFVDPKESCRIVLENFPEIPFWPQLPKRSYLENMYVQFSEGLPGVVVDEKNRSIHVETQKAANEVELVYERYLAQDLDSFGISEDRALGLYEFLDTAKDKGISSKFIKGQITGPVSFALSVTDQNRRAIIYDADLFESATKILSMKALWQIEKLKKVNPNVIIFVDEPYLVSIGSSYINVDVAKAAEKLDETIDAIKRTGALCGIHCCGNTDWAFILSRPIDILSFDAYNFIRQFFLYVENLKKFLGNGGTIAWGIVPTSNEIEKETKDTLFEKFKEGSLAATEKDLDIRRVSSMVTPSCGAGTLDEKKAKRIFTVTNDLSNALKDL